MPLEGFDYKTFAQELSSQADELLPAQFQDFQKKYVVNTINNFATLCGEAIYNDEKVKFTLEQAMLLTQIIAEWSFHKSVDIIKAGILPDYWDSIMQKIAFTIFEIGKQTILNGLPQDEVLQIIEHHVKKSYQTVLEELKQRQIIDQTVMDRALHQSNIDDMMEQLQEEGAGGNEVSQPQVKQSSGGTDYKTNSKILKLASVALLLKQISQDKVQTILNKFSTQDAQSIIQYMQMPDLETKVDKNIAIKCLQEIKINLPEPKFINSSKIMDKMNKIFQKLSKEKIEKIIISERPLVKEFVSKASEGEYFEIPSKVANIIAQHLEGSVV